MADATVRSLLTRVAEVLGPTEPASTVHEPAGPGPPRAGQRPKCLARLRSGERIRLLVIYAPPYGEDPTKVVKKSET